MRVVRDGTERTINITVDELDYDAENQQARQEPVAPPDARETSRGFGVELDNVTAELSRRFQLKDTRGAMVRGVDPDGPAAGNLRPGDVITQVGGVPVATAAEAGRELNRVPSGETATLRITRPNLEGGRPRDHFLTLTKD
jgi:S1-C subfamily serine protease